jgi:hypothetical protein
MRSNFSALTSARHYSSVKSTVDAQRVVALLAHRTVRCTPDSLVNYSGACPLNSREWLVRCARAWGSGHYPVRQRQHTLSHFAPILFVSPTEFLSWFVLILMHSKLKNLNANLNVKLESNFASSFVEHVVICNRCKDFNIDACNEHVYTIIKLNNDVASLNAQLKTCKDNYEKLKFARDTYTIGRHPSIKDGLGFQKSTKNLTSQRTSNLNKEKGKAPMASSSYSLHDQKNLAYLYAHVKNVSSVAHHDRCHKHAALTTRHDVVNTMFATSSLYTHGRNRSRHHHVASHVPRKASTGPTTLYQTCDASFVLICKNDKVVARSLGPKCKRDKTCIWVPKSVVTNLVGPNKSWVPKTQA